jgi:hypothetical protein
MIRGSHHRSIIHLHHLQEGIDQDDGFPLHVVCHPRSAYLLHESELDDLKPAFPHNSYQDNYLLILCSFWIFS